jgi:oligoendopeptidase F
MTASHELMRHLLVDIPEDDQRHLVDVVDRNHAEQLQRKRASRREHVGLHALEFADEETEPDED